ncbi:MAG: polyhydroxyalkanoate synthesis repressor PhaR [Geminicoccaceae bacterium]
MASERAGGKRSDIAVVKKYANRRLYNTATSSYVTLDELCRMVRQGEEFVVYDAKTSEDITRSVLTQIILEEDGKGRNLLPISFLRSLIGYYDDSLRAFLPRYLELSMENFARNQDTIRQYIEGTFGRVFPMAQFEEMARINMAMFQKAARIFSPFPVESGEAIEGEDGELSAELTSEQRVSDLKRQIELLQLEITRLETEASAEDAPSKVVGSS